VNRLPGRQAGELEELTKIKNELKFKILILDILNFKF
jgi:hypothetical protein